ncbi:hypothetical protein [Ktedonospora formicarum]|uniref:Uncharacterized protein n=1 Tax=Ktedonospora formicarum TaxID=2778364 RepID=A0A8J3I3E1_9CHLR|nr:hypothetical protein [Ktedonospora formicarum]GHO48569.1 hypothetical protein KSX_67320 [Ktedonospora formicarum]
MEPHIYQLPVRILLETMRTLQETASLQATFSLMQQGQTLDALIQLVLERGEVLSCDIRLLQGGVCLAQGDAAFHLLAQAGILDWQVMPRQPLSLLTPENALRQENSTTEREVVSSTVPKQAADLHDRRVTLLSPKGRQVFLLSNGTRSCDDIARLLCLSGESMQQVMHTLLEQQLITWQVLSS